MNLKFLTVSMLALAVASTVALTGCQREEAADVEVTPGTEEVVVPAEGDAMTTEETEVNVTEEAAPAEEHAADEAATTEEPAEEAAH